MDENAQAVNADRRMLEAMLKDCFGIEARIDLGEFEAEFTFGTLRPGEILFREGEPGAEVCFVLSGRLRSYRLSPAGEIDVLGEIGRGETVGELAFLTDTARSATVVAVRDTRVAFFGRRAFEGLLARQPHVATSMMRLVVERFRMREQGRRSTSRPVTIAAIRVSPAVDLQGFVVRLAAARRGQGARVAVLSRPDAATTGELDGLARHGPAAALIQRQAQACDSVFLVAEEDLSPWTERCLEAADEILLVASSRDQPDLARIERQIDERGNARSRARQTLALLHPPRSARPGGTAAWLATRTARRHLHVREGVDRDMSRLARILAGRAVGVVLSGGGARGLAQLGTMRALTEAGIDADLVGGASMGAIVAAMDAMDVRGDALVAAGRFALEPGVMRDLNWLPIFSLFKGKRAEKIVRGLIARAMGTDELDSRDLWKPHFCIASNYSTGGEAVLRSGPLWRNLMASTAIPGLFSPQIIDGNILFDGATFNNFPVDVMERQEAAVIIGVDLLGDRVRTCEVDRVPGAGRYLLDRLRPRSKWRYRIPTLPETLLAATVIGSQAKQRMMRTRVDLHLTPDVTGVGLLDWRKCDAIIEAGYAHTLRRLERLTSEQLARLR
jgi:NTE family protein